MWRDQLFALFTVLGACCTALQVSDEQLRQNTAAVRSCVRVRANSSNSVLFRQLVTLKTQAIAGGKPIQDSVNSDEPKGREVSFFKALAPHYNSLIGVFYFVAWLCDILIALFETFSLGAGVDASTSVYTVLNQNDTCRQTFSTAMASNTADLFKAAADCIQNDMDKCVNTAYLWDMLATWISALQSILDSVMSALEFRHSNHQTKMEMAASDRKEQVSDNAITEQLKVFDDKITTQLSKTSGEIMNLQKLMCSAESYAESNMCEDLDIGAHDLSKTK
jgi:hypothetical protein